MFQGSFVHAVDPKGRVSVPAKFREVILGTKDDRLVVTNFREQSTPCLDVYPIAAWTRLQERMSQRPQFDRKVRTFTRYYIANAQECQVDRQGRMLLPPMLRAYAQLGDTVTFAGFNEKFQIWDRGNWARVFEESEKAIFEDPEFFTEFPIG
jgi:MraZ protein